MKEDLLKIINHYGVLPQLKYFQSEVFELNEAIIEYENCGYLEYEEVEEQYKKHIAEEISDVLVMLKQFQHYYGISDEEIFKTMQFKIERQLKRLNNDKNNNN